MAVKVDNGRRFLTPLVCAGCLLTGWMAAFTRAERSRTPPDLPEQTAFHSVSRRPAQTSGVRALLRYLVYNNNVYMIIVGDILRVRRIAGLVILYCTNLRSRILIICRNRWLEDILWSRRNLGFMSVLRLRFFMRIFVQILTAKWVWYSNPTFITSKYFFALCSFLCGIFLATHLSDHSTWLPMT